MTAQINDGFTYRGGSYDLVGLKGTGLFEPSSAGIFCAPMHTACWRGYITTYTVVDGELRIAKLEMQLHEPKAPLVYGHAHTKLTESGYATFEDIPARVPFTGGVLLGRDFIRELYVHMGFHPAWKYREVHELVLDDGRVVGESDRSAAMAELREKLSKQPQQPMTANEPELRAWIERCFERQYF